MHVNYLNGTLAWQIHEFSSIVEPTGELGVLEILKDFDFPVRRVFFLRNLKSDAERGFHAHEELKQIIVCLAGSFKISLDCGVDSTNFSMQADNKFLELDGKVWREMREFSEDCLIAVLCDREYSLDKVVRDIDEFKRNLVSVNEKF